MVDKVLRRRPQPTSEVRGGVLQGPVISSRLPSEIIKGQKELDRRLEREAYKLFRKEYPSRAATYR